MVDVGLSDQFDYYLGSLGELGEILIDADQSASVEPAGFRMLVGAVRKIEQAMGDGKLGYIKKEMSIAENLRQHLSWKSSGLE